jgi:hypothetical protein
VAAAEEAAAVAEEGNPFSQNLNHRNLSLI